MTLDCKEDSLAQIIQLRDSVIRDLERQTVVVKEKYVPQYYKSTSIGFWVLLAILLVFVGLKIARIYLTGGIL